MDRKDTTGIAVWKLERITSPFSHKSLKERKREPSAWGYN
jgi:hypothetical protein